MKALLASLVVVAASTAMAAKSNNEYYFQPASGAQAVDLQYNWDQRNTKTATQPAGVESDFKSEFSDFYADYMYGLNENHALGILLYSGSHKTTVGTSSVTGTGLGDIHLLYKGFAQMWHWGADWGINTDKAKYDTATGIQNNVTSGGMSLKLNGGVLATAGAWNYGGDLSYNYLFERDTDLTPATKFADGSTLKLAGFGEMNYGAGFFGGELSYNSVADTTMKRTTESKIKGENYFGLKLYGTYDFTDMVTGLLNVAWNMHPEHDYTDGVNPNKVKAFTETNLFAGVRLNF